MLRAYPEFIVQRYVGNAGCEYTVGVLCGMDGTLGIVVRGGPSPRRGCCLLGLLLAGHGALGALAGARIGLGALAVHRQVTAVAQTRYLAYVTTRRDSAKKLLQARWNILPFWKLSKR